MAGLRHRRPRRGTRPSVFLSPRRYPTVCVRRFMAGRAGCPARPVEAVPRRSAAESGCTSYRTRVSRAALLCRGSPRDLGRRVRQADAGSCRLLRVSTPAWSFPTRPTQRVGGTPREGVEKADHSSQMLSLDNAFDEGELRDFDRRARDRIETDSITYVGELKFDGVLSGIAVSRLSARSGLDPGGRQAGRGRNAQRSNDSVCASLPAYRDGQQLWRAG